MNIGWSADNKFSFSDEDNDLIASQTAIPTPGGQLDTISIGSGGSGRSTPTKQVADAKVPPPRPGAPPKRPPPPSAAPVTSTTALSDLSVGSAWDCPESVQAVSTVAYQAPATSQQSAWEDLVVVRNSTPEHMARPHSVSFKCILYDQLNNW